MKCSHKNHIKFKRFLLNTHLDIDIVNVLTTLANKLRNKTVQYNTWETIDPLSYVLVINLLFVVIIF